MRNYFTIAFAVFYLVFTSGFVISAHYCHGQFKYVKPALAIEDSCESEEVMACCASEDFGDQEENCCDEDTYLVYFETEQKPVVPPNPFNLIEIAHSDVSVEALSNNLPTEVALTDYEVDDETFSSGTDVRLSQCSLVFYG